MKLKQLNAEATAAIACGKAWAVDASEACRPGLYAVDAGPGTIVMCSAYGSDTSSAQRAGLRLPLAAAG